MKEYWVSLQPRERYVLLGGAAVLLALLFYLWLIEPAVEGLKGLEKRVAQQQEELAWMRAAAAEVERLRSSSTGQARASSGQSLLSLIDSSAKAQGLGSSLKQISPMGDKVRVRLEGVALDTLLQWLHVMEQEAAVAVSTLTLDRLQAAGMADASVVLARGGQ